MLRTSFLYNIQTQELLLPSTTAQQRATGDLTRREVAQRTTASRRTVKDASQLPQL